MIAVNVGTIYFFLIVVGLPVICGTFIIALVIMTKARGTKKTRAQEAEETQLIQEIHRGLNNLEKRIESIETLVIEREKNRRE